MRIHSISFAILSSLVLVACGGAGKNLGDAKDPGGDPWKDYKGTYATTANPKMESADKPASAKAAKAKAEPKPAPAPAAAPAAPPQDEAEAAAEAALAEANAQGEPTMNAEPAPKKGAKAAPKRAAKKGRK